MAAATRAAALRAGRKRSRISYREPSTSDEEDVPASESSSDDISHSADGNARKRRRQSTRVHHSQSQSSQQTARRGRPTYRDPASDIASNREAHTPPPTRRSRSHGLLSASPEVPTKLRRLPTKSYQLPSSDGASDPGSDDNGESRTEDAGPSRPRRTKRVRAQSSQSSARLRREPAPLYTETNSEGDTGDAFEVAGHRTRMQKRRGGPRRTTRASAAKKDARRGQSRGTRRSDRESTRTKKHPVLESDGVIPPWASLPYEILLQIFTYASDPLHDEDFNPTPSISWLVTTARVCRTFTEPALTALYRCPPLLMNDKPHKLLELLANTSSSRCINYNVKIRRLEFDVIKALAYVWTGKGPFEIGDLIPYVPQLNEISITHPQDRPPFRPFSRSGRWHYSQALFTTLEENKTRLKSWDWNSNFRSREQTLSWMGSIHQMEAFQRLVHLSLLNFSDEPLTEVTNEGDQRTSKQVLADNLSVLPQLRSLSFESCPILDEGFLPLLKEDLQQLAIVNCHNVTSKILRDFLVSHGSQLENLVLNHNQALDISFLPDLKRACPRLEVFKMDLNYYDSHASFRDSDPKYLNLLEEDEIPSWPSTLQVLEMVHLRQWTSTAAENFFSSLLDSAEDLPELRRLVLKAILNIGWRDRAGFRDKWIGRLERVFLRDSPQPNPAFMSGKRFKMWKESFLPMSPDPNTPPHLVRRLSHVEVTPRGKVKALPTPENQNNNAGDDSGPSRRLRPRRALDFAESDTEGSGDEERLDNSGSDEGEVLKAIQGMCEVVDIRIDNQRPREEQFNENDFLDSEASGDEDWNGDDDLPGDDRYAW